MVLGGFKTVYADIISTPALALLCEAGIETTFAQEVPHIINRDKTGWCPLETACMELNTVEEMYPVIQNFISRIRQNSNSLLSFPDYLMPFSSSILKSSLSIPTSSSVRASLWSFR